MPQLWNVQVLDLRDSGRGADIHTKIKIRKKAGTKENQKGRAYNKGTGTHNHPFYVLSCVNFLGPGPNYSTPKESPLLLARMVPHRPTCGPPLYQSRGARVTRARKCGTVGIFAQLKKGLKSSPHVWP
uniref:ARAD1B18920p n=1 Tax=Blastobotrys adeninivorans TaxID=409370 RepID=A0A060TCW7_BLAAD